MRSNSGVWPPSADDSTSHSDDQRLICLHSLPMCVDSLLHVQISKGPASLETLVYVYGFKIIILKEKP